MRIRDHLRALATSQLAAGRSPTREPVEAARSAEPAADERDGLGEDELARQLAERMARSLRDSEHRLRETADVLAIIVQGVRRAARALDGRATARAPSGELELPFGEALTAAHRRAPEGDFLLASDASPTALFGADGAFLGQASPALLVAVGADRSCLAVAASALTGRAALPGAVDVLAVLARAAAAPRLDDTRRLALLTSLALADQQVVRVHAKVELALELLDDARRELEVLEAEDEGSPPGQPAQIFGALEAARSPAERTLAIFP